MSLLTDYAVTPDVFDETSYSSAELCLARLDVLREVLLNEGLVRDLREGEWRQVFAAQDRSWHRRGRELLRKLASQGRLVRFAPALSTAPTDDERWCAEAVGTHQDTRFRGGVIVTEPVKAAFAAEPIVARVDRLGNAQWWAGRSSSVKLPRSLAAYREELAPVLSCATSIMFIDPHLDPAKPGYRDFPALLAVAGGRAPRPRIELHRVCYEGSGPARRFPTRDDPGYFERRFRSKLEAMARDRELSVDVFIWDEFHDRHLISNLVGVLMANGFDTTTNANSLTRWGRLGRSDRDDVQREFDVASKRHVLRSQFTIA